MSDVPAFSFLPPPRIPITLLLELPDPAWLDSLHAGGGDFIREWQQLHATVLSAIDAVESGRPAGQAWAEAMRADADAVAAGKTPKVWATGELLKGDHDRWARASAEARTITVRVKALRASAPASALIEAAKAVSEALREPLLNLSERAYQLAVGGGERGEAWTHYDAATEMAAVAARHNGLAAWLDGRDTRFDPKGWGAPWTAEARGFYLAAGYALKPQERPLTMPQGVVWPDSINLPNVPVGAYGQALRTAGYADPNLSQTPLKPAAVAAANAERFADLVKAAAVS